METTLKIIQELPIQEGVGRNGNPWKVASFVGETQEQYARKVHFEIFGEERINNNPCKVDDIVTVSFDIESREYNGRWFTSIRAWKVAASGDANQSAQIAESAQPVVNAQPEQAIPVQQSQTIPGEGDGSGLPF